MALPAKSGELQALEGQPRLLEQACVSFRRWLVYRLVTVYRVRVEDADDAAQEALIRLVQHLHELDPELPLKAWLLKVARNVNTDHYRKYRREELRLPPEDWSAELEAPDDENTFQLHLDLRQCEAGLPPQQRAACRARREGTSLQQVADELGISRTTLDNRLTEAFSNLRVCLEARGWTADLAYAAACRPAPFV